MAFKLKAKQPAKAKEGAERTKGPAVNHGPGLNDGETALELDSGETVSLVIETERQPHGAGLVFIAVTRVLNADGSTAVDDAGGPIFTEFRHTADARQIDELGVDAIAKEMALAILGEPPSKKGVDDLIPWSVGLKLNVSVRNVNKLARSSGRAVDLKSVLSI